MYFFYVRPIRLILLTDDFDVIYLMLLPHNVMNFIYLFGQLNDIVPYHIVLNVMHLANP